MATKSHLGTSINNAGRRAPGGPQGHRIWGNLRDLQHDRLKFVVDTMCQHGDIARYRVAFWTFYQVNHPEYIKHILQENYRNYSKDTPGMNLAKRFLGNGLLLSEGTLWLRQRRLMQPAFHRQRIAALANVMTQETHAALERWQAAADCHQPLDMAKEMMRLTLGIATKTLFSTDKSNKADLIGRAFAVISEDLVFRFDNPFYPPLAVPTPRNRRFYAALQQLDRVVLEIIAERKGRTEDSHDLLAMLMEARDEETGEGMNALQLRDEVVTLLLAGHETTASVLTWTWYLLSTHPEVERRLQAELAEVLEGRTPTADDVPRLHYTRMVIEETMRLYPPAWILSRKAIADDRLASYDVPANTLIAISPYAVHRHPDFWPNPEGFDPERFAPECAANRPRFAYLPFGGGPRKCIGNTFAMMEAQLLLATIAQHYRLDLVPGHAVEPSAQVTLRPRNGLPMSLHER